MQIQLTDTAVKQFEKIAKSDKANAIKIRNKLKEYAENPNGNHDIKQLKGRLRYLMRLRVGDYRILFQVKKPMIIIASIKHRQGAYDD